MRDLLKLGSVSTFALLAILFTVSFLLHCQSHCVWQRVVFFIRIFTTQLYIIITQSIFYSRFQPRKLSQNAGSVRKTIQTAGRDFPSATRQSSQNLFEQILTQSLSSIDVNKDVFLSSHGWTCAEDNKNCGIAENEHLHKKNVRFLCEVIHHRSRCAWLEGKSHSFRHAFCSGCFIRLNGSQEVLC